MAEAGARKYPAAAVQVGPDELGRRVTLRSALPTGGFSDTIGVLLRWDGEEVEVQTAKGLTVLPLAGVVAARVVS